MLASSGLQSTYLPNFRTLDKALNLVLHYFELGKLHKST